MITIPYSHSLFAKPLHPTPAFGISAKRIIGLVLGTLLGLGTAIAFAEETCPWKETPYSTICPRWETLMQRLETAMKEAEAAAEKLATLEPSPEAESTPMPAAEKRVRAIIDRLLENLPPPAPEMGGFKIERDYTLIRQDDTYEAHFPTATWIAESNRVDFGPLIFRIEPREGGLSRLDFHFGNLIKIQEDDQPATIVLLGEQKNEGIWDDRLQNFARAQSQFRDIHGVAVDEPFLMSIDHIDLTQTLSREDDDTWNQQQTFELGPVHIQLENSTVELQQSLGEIGLNGRDYDKFATLNSTLANLAQGDPEASETPAHLMESISELYALFTRLDFNLISTGLVVRETKDLMFQIGRLTLSSGFEEGKDEQGSTLSYQIDLADLQAPQTDLPVDLLPTDARLEMGWYNIPPQLFNQILEISLASEKLPAKERDDYINQQLTGLILTSNLGMYIKDTFLAAPATRIDLSFDAHLEPQAALGGVGKLSLRIEGLQKLMDYAASQKEEQSAAGFLAMLVALSERTQQDGKVIDSFRVELNPEGQLWLNGKDVTNLFIPPEAQENLPDTPESSE